MSGAALLWPYVERSIERLVATFEELDPDGRTWQPRAEHANSIASLVSHTLSNAEENLLQGICGEPVAAGRGNDFASPEIDPIAVRARWSRLRNRFVARLPSLEHRDMLGTVADPRRGEITRFEVLMVVARHAVEHLAQAELTRDLYRGR